jgi:hypothetical protein
MNQFNIFLRQNHFKKYLKAEAKTVIKHPLKRKIKKRK